MSLRNRKSRKEISFRQAGELLSCCGKTAKRIAKREGWATRTNGTGPTSKMLVLEADVIAFKERMARLAEVG